MILIGGYNLLLAFDQARRAGTYRALGVDYPPEARALLALGWGIGLIAAAVRLIRRERHARRRAWIVLSNYGVFGVLWMISFARSDFGRDRIAFQAVVTALLIALAGWVLRWRRVAAAFEPDS